MPTAEHMRATVEAYAAAHSAGDIDGIVEVFASDAVVADPVDQPAHHGREAIRAFFANTHEFIDSMELRVTGPIRAVDRFAAVPFQAVSVVGGSKVAVDIIDVMTFDDAGKITTMRAFWDPAEMRPAE